jgi:hypothetical protein
MGVADLAGTTREYRDRCGAQGDDFGERYAEGDLQFVLPGGEARLRQVVAAGGFSRFRRAAATPFNLVLEARP